MRPLKYDIENSFGSIVRRADMALMNRLNQNFKNTGYDITTEQYRALVNLWNQNGQTQRELAEATGKNKASVTRLINGLEKRNLVVRVPNRLDNRNNLIYLTDKGKQIPQTLTNLARQTVNEALMGISEEKQALCKDVLCAVVDNLNLIAVKGNTEGD
jgi:DNA-binding MarR family transcriptional regulator